MNYQYGGSPRGYDAYNNYRTNQGSPMRAASPERYYQPSYTSPVYSSGPRTPPSQERSPYRSYRMGPSLSTVNVAVPPPVQTSYNGIYSSPSSNGSPRRFTEHRLLTHPVSQPCRSIETYIKMKRLSGIQLQPVDLFNKEHKSPELMRINPSGQVPALVMADQPESLSESLAILKYLDSERNTGFVPKNPKEAALLDEYCGFHLSGVRKLSTDYFLKFIFGGPGMQDSGKEVLTKTLNSLETRLKKYPYIAGYQMSIGDFLVVPEVDQLLFMPGNVLSSEHHPNLVAYIYRMHQIPAFKESFEGARAALQKIGKI